MRLGVEGVVANYGHGPVLRGVTLEVPDGQIVALVGRNGMGKTTVLRAIAGQLRVVKGAISLDDAVITNLTTHAISRLGMAYVPEDRGIFSSMSVDENILVAAEAARGGDAVALVRSALDWFPELGRRPRVKAGLLSGGQQQMLAMARALATGARMWLVDEPTQGLSPEYVAATEAGLQRLRQEGVSVLLVEQNLRVAVSLADRIYVLAKGAVVYGGTPNELLEDQRVIEEYLLVGGSIG